ncbi:MAG: hypothetical protein D6757_01700 [Alphaproteobacteria bacterium]|nr:MAG: hypothetical protein D6757_01700 [Alphaproteobacteria bacterium]
MSRKIDKRLLGLLTPAALLASTAMVHAQSTRPFDPLPGPNTYPPAEVLSDDGVRIEINTQGTRFPQSYPYGEDATNPSNLLPTIYGNSEDSGGNEIPNTLPSTPDHPYNLHPDPVVSDLPNALEQEDDLAIIIRRLKEAVFPRERLKTRKTFFRGGVGVPADPRRGVEDVTGPNAGRLPAPARRVDLNDVQMAIDILEGNPVADRIYSGISLLNYDAGVRVSKAAPGTNVVNVHQVWARRNIFSDTAFICPFDTGTPDCADAADLREQEWIIRYTIDVSRRGHEDFAPFVTYWDNPDLRGGKRVPAIAFDQTFFPMEAGKRYIFEVKMAPAKFFNLTYHWGWRIHPTRIQAIENASKILPCVTADNTGNAGQPATSINNPMELVPTNLIQCEHNVFGDNPKASEEAKVAAISMISDYSPAKRMWKAFRALRDMQGHGPRPLLRALVREIEAAFRDWQNRAKLPRGLEPAEGFDVTMAFMNNLLYGEIPGIPENFQQRWDEYQTRGATLEVKIYNTDYFPHGYMNVDFGGARGWENTFHNTLPVGGQGPWFTFGRNAFMANLPGLVFTPAAMRPEDDSIFALLSNGHYRRGYSNRGRMLMGGRAHDYDARKAAMLKAGYVEDQYEGVAGRMDVNGVDENGFGERDVIIHFRHDPPQRLRFYQFDPTHHNNDIWSVH